MSADLRGTAGPVPGPFTAGWRVLSEEILPPPSEAADG
jgi:hypothetical protein